jgi:hypothetical protein
MTYYYGYQLAAGWNGAGSLVDIQSIIPTGDRRFVAPQGYSGFDEGVLRVRLDKQRYLTGHTSFPWLFDVLTVAQYRYLMATYTTGGNSYSGKVTARTRIPSSGAFANYNAILYLPKLPELTRKYLSYRDVVIQFVDAVAL